MAIGLLHISIGFLLPTLHLKKVLGKMGHDIYKIFKSWNNGNDERVVPVKCPVRGLFVPTNLGHKSIYYANKDNKTMNPLAS